MVIGHKEAFTLRPWSPRNSRWVKAPAGPLQGGGISTLAPADQQASVRWYTPGLRFCSGAAHIPGLITSSELKKKRVEHYEGKGKGVNKGGPTQSRGPGRAFWRETLKDEWMGWRVRGEHARQRQRLVQEPSSGEIMFVGKTGWRGENEGESVMRSSWSGRRVR